MSTMERFSEGDNHKHIDYRNALRIASFLIMISGIGEFFDLTLRTVPQVNKELNALVPEEYTSELVQQARKKVSIFEAETKRLILEDKTKDILPLVRQTDLKNSIQIVNNQDSINTDRAIMKEKLEREKHFVPKVIIALFGSIFGAMGAVASSFSEEKINRKIP